MELDVRLDKESMGIQISNPFQLDMFAIEKQVHSFLATKGLEGNEFDLRVLIPRMVRGIAGCEAGCPSDALSVVRKGDRKFKLEYIEGGILTATTEVGGGRMLSLKLFPDF